MKNLISGKLQTLLVALGLALLATLNFQLSTCSAQGTAFTYQGRLNFNASPAAGNYDFRFRVAADANGNTFVGSAVITNGVPVTNGLFLTTLDFGAGIFTGGNLWLQIEVKTNGAAGYALLNPLQTLTPTPYAMFANTASNVSGTVSAAQIGGGTLANSVLPASPNFSGTVTASSLSGNGAGVANVNAATLNGLNGSNFWKSSGNAGTSPANGNFLGTTDNQPLVLKVNGQQVARYEPTTATPNLIGGFSGNSVQAGLFGATISGGGYSPNGINSISNGGNYGTIAGGLNNTVTNFGGTVLGGEANFNGSVYGVIGGGYLNMAQGNYVVIGGGSGNTINAGADDATISGGVFSFILTNSTSAVIGGGYNNSILADSRQATISGGAVNVIQTNSYCSVISGGYLNQIRSSSYFASVIGGLHNIVGNAYAVIAGGLFNTNNGSAAFIGGGANNFVGTNSGYSFLGGGYYNNLTGYASVIGGGQNNVIQLYADNSMIGGGQNNSIVGSVLQVADVISGGYQNSMQTNSTRSVIGGGQNNIILANARSATISGGTSNQVAGSGATVPGGSGNAALADSAFAAGNQAQAIHAGAFVWADSQNTNFYSTASDQFAVRASGGVLLNAGTNNVEIASGGIKVTGAGIGSSTAVFVHRATAANIEAGSTHRTTINNPYCNGDSNAVLFVTANYNPGSTGSIIQNHPYGVFYNALLAKWQIFNEDIVALTTNTAFNVMIVKP